MSIKSNLNWEERMAKRERLEKLGIKQPRMASKILNGGTINMDNRMSRSIYQLKHNNLSAIGQIKEKL